MNNPIRPPDMEIRLIIHDNREGTPVLRRKYSGFIAIDQPYAEVLHDAITAIRDQAVKDIFPEGS